MADIDSALPIRSKQDVDERVQSKLVDYTNPALGMEIDADSDAHVKAKLRDDSGAAFGIESNPVYVTTTDNPQDEIHDFNQAVAIAKDASADHSYSPTAGAKIRRVHLAATGFAKFEISFGVTGAEVLKYVYFNSTAQPSVDVTFDSPITLAATDSIVVTKTNLDNQAQDLYSTINGDEAP